MAFNYKQQYAVVVMCKDEKEQESIYNRLKEEGWELKTRKALNTLGDISESFNFPVCQVLYAELEREIEQFEEVTL